MNPTGAHVDLRRRPAQARSSATFDALLECAGTLLESRGAASFTTNLLAAESGISIRAIYRYFPNKQAIVAELARRFSSQWMAAVSLVGDLGDCGVPWEPVWRGYLDAWLRAVVATPGGRAVIAAVRDDPELRAVDDEVNEHYVADISTALRSRSPSLPEPRADVAARMLMRTTIGVLDEAVSCDEPRRSAMLRELQTMHVHYLASLIGKDLP